jgi:serine/threonine protein phosphatase PrpC
VLLGKWAVPLSWLPLGLVRASASVRAAALQSAKIEDVATPPNGAVTWLAGGKQSKGALPHKTAMFDAAVYSSRGRGYARYNEDAAALFADASGRLYSAVFDQAGGLGGRIRGAASEIAALRMFEAWKEIAAYHGKEPLDEGARLIAAMSKAHEELIERKEGEVTTAVACLAKGNLAIVVNSGDSGAMHFGPDGTMKTATLMHEHESPIAVGCLTHAIGLMPESPAPDTYRWELGKGDWVMLATDGLLDAGLSAKDLGELLTQADSAESAVNKIATRILRMMTTLRAKPDNLSLVALRAL